MKWLGAATLLLALAIAGAVAIFWAPDKPVAELEARWAPPPSQFMVIDGLRVHLRDQGPGNDSTPLVLLHGTSASLHTWEGWVPGLSENRRVVSMDLPGFGLTGPFPQGDYSTRHYTQFLTALMDRLGIERAVLVGSSFGGQIAIEMALDQPARVEKLVLIDALAYPRNSTSVPIGFRLAAMPEANLVLRHVLPRRLVEASVRDVYGDPERVTPELVERYYQLTLRAGNRASLPERFAQLPTAESASRISNIRQPTLILWGGRDRLIPPDNGRLLRQQIPGSRLLVFPELGHVPHEEAPAQTLGAVREFLAE